MLSRIPGSQLLTVAFSILLIGSVLISGFLLLNGARDVTDKIIADASRATSDEARAEINRFLSAPHSVGNLISASINNGFVNTDDQNDLAKLFFSLLSQESLFPVSIAYFSNTDGEFVGVGNNASHWSYYESLPSKSATIEIYETDADGSKGEYRRAGALYDARKRPWYKEALQKENVTWTNFYGDPEHGNPVITWTGAVKGKDGSLIGVFGIDLFLKHITSFVQELPVSPNTVVFLSDSNGRVISTNRESTKPEQNDSERRDSETLYSIDPMVRAAIEKSQIAGIESKELFSGHVELLGQRGFLHVAPIDESTELNWTISIFVPAADYLASQGSQALKVIPLIMLTLGIAGATLYGFTQFVSRPINKLKQTANEIASGNFQVEINTTGTNEVDELANAIDSMRNNLQVAFDHLSTQKLELIDSREQIALINRMTPAHIAHIDTTGRYTYSNGRLPSIVPTARADVVGRHFEEVLEGVLEKVMASQVSQCFDKALTGESTVVEYSYAKSERHIRVATSPDVQDDGTVAGAYILSTDVTKEVKARQALADERRKTLATQLTSVMAHDFANLLTIVMSQEDMLEKHAGGDPVLMDICETIKSATHRGAELIDNLNGINSQRDVDPVTVKSSNFFFTLQQLTRAAVPDGMNVSFDIEVPDRSLVLDPGIAQDALLNLVINASEACNGAGQLNIRVSKKLRDELEFIVTDNGPGFTDECLDNALNPFYSTKGRKVGRGLGLTSAFDFAKSSGGNLHIRNTESGGAQVIMSIPCQPVLNHQNDVDSQLVLLVDDDDELRNSISHYLRATGRSVIEASTVDEAVRHSRAEDVACVVTDLDLGSSGTGLDVIDSVSAEISKLIITGLPESDPIRQQAQRNFNLLSKPFRFDALDCAISQMLNERTSTLEDSLEV